MTRIAVLAALFALAGCASQETQLAKAECKIAPITTRSVTGNPGPTTELDRKWAAMQLGSSEYRRAQMQRNTFNNNVEDALKDCY